MTTTNSNTNSNNEAPVEKFRDRALCVSIWKNTHFDAVSGETKTYYSLDFRRSYKQDSTWKHTSAVRAQDGLRVANLYTRASNWVIDQGYPMEGDSAAEQSGEDNPSDNIQ